MTTTLIDGQHQLGTVLIGKSTPISIAAIEGLGRAPQRTADVDPPGEDGTWLGADLFSGRQIRIDAAVKTPGDYGGALDVVSSLLEAADQGSVRTQAGTTLNLRLKFPGRDVRVVRGRLRKCDTDLTKAIHGWVPLDIEFQAADHLFYADSPDTTGISLGTINTGGLTFPLQFPFVISGDPAAVGRPGYIQVDGTAPTWPVLRVNGPCSNPTITHVTSGRVLSVQVTLAAGEWVEIDTRPGLRTVRNNSGGAVPLSPTSRIDLFQLSTGLNEIRWTATDNTLTSTLSVTWWPAWKAL